MNKFILLILSLALASLACLQTTMQIEPDGTSAPTAVPAASLFATPEEQEEYSGAVYEVPEVAPILCAVVTVERVNVRRDATYHSPVIYWLYAKDAVKIVQRGAWSKIESREGIGYVRADYLKESECE